MKNKPRLTVMPVLLSFSSGFATDAVANVVSALRAEQLQEAVPVDGDADGQGATLFALKPGIRAEFFSEALTQAQALGATHGFDVTFCDRPTGISTRDAETLNIVADRPGMSGPLRQWLADDVSPEAQVILAKLPRPKRNTKQGKQVAKPFDEVVGTKKRSRNVTWEAAKA